MFRLIVPLAILLVLAGILRLQSRRTGRTPRLRWLPKGGSDALLQLSLFVMADILYETVRGVAESNAATAFSNARGIASREIGLSAVMPRTVPYGLAPVIARHIRVSGS